MTVKPKIKIFIVIMLLALFTESCNRDKYDVIPDVYVDFIINLNDIQFFNLTAPLGVDTVNYFTNNWGAGSAGYDNNGIIVIRAFDDEFYAYDRTCPHDFAVNSTSVKVKVDGIYAVCPVCGTNYALPANGTPSSGPGQYPLKNYRTSFDGLNVHVWNY